MIQVYAFSDEGGSSKEASFGVSQKVNAFIERADVEVTQVLQSESQSVSVWDGMNDWSYTSTITLVVKVPENRLERIQDLYAEINL